MFIINFFLLFNLCGFFFAILCFFCLFVFFCYTCLVFCWFWGTGLTVSFALLFIVICLFFFFQFIFIFLFLFIYLFFFYLHGFSGFIFCKFNCSWHFFTSSDRVPLGGGCTGAPFRGLVSRGSKLYKWWFGKASGLVDIELMNMVPRKRLTMGWEDDTWAQSGVRLLLPPGWSWLDDLGDGVNCFVFFFLSFENPWWLMAERLVLFVAGGSEGPQVGRWIPQCFLEHYSCYDTDRTAEITDAPTS